MASSNTRNAPESYIGSFISLISKYEIRYEGVLYHLNVNDSTIGLKDVRSYGTEQRKKDGPQVPPSDKVYDYILFRGSDIKDLEVKSPPPSQKKEDEVYKDPAILQSQYASLPMNSPPPLVAVGKTLSELSQWLDTPAVTSRANPGALPSHPPATQVGQLNHLLVTQSAASPSFPSPMYWQGYNGTPMNISYFTQNPFPLQSPSTVSSSLTKQNGIQTSECHTSQVPGLITPSGCVAYGPSSIASNSLHPNFSSLLPSTTAYMTNSPPTLTSVPSSCQDTKTIEAQIVGKVVSDPVIAHPAQSMHNPASSFLVSTSGTLPTPPPSLLTADQLVPSRPLVLSSTQAMCPDQEDMLAVLPSLSNSPSAVSPQASQRPLLPLPTLTLQSQYSTTQFTEEFDFEAMNKKFKKDEVWGYLGKAKQRDKTENVEDNATDQSFGAKEANGIVKNADPKPAYTKDDFFDTISCNSLGHGTPDGQKRFSERMKLDTETFGNIQQREHPGYGGYDAGRGRNYRGSYNGGRGHGYGGRRHGGSMHI